MVFELGAASHYVTNHFIGHEHLNQDILEDTLWGDGQYWNTLDRCSLHEYNGLFEVSSLE